MIYDIKGDILNYDLSQKETNQLLHDKENINDLKSLRERLLTEQYQLTLTQSTSMLMCPPSKKGELDCQKHLGLLNILRLQLHNDTMKFNKNVKSIDWQNFLRLCLKANLTCPDVSIIDTPEKDESLFTITIPEAEYTEK